VPEGRERLPSLLAEIVDTAVEFRGVILGATGIAVALAGVYLFLAVPQFGSDVLIQVEEKGRGLLSHLEEVPGIVPGTTPTETEIQILRSRTLLGTVVDELQLQLVARPRWVPVIGAAVARRRDLTQPGSPFLGLSSFAWGGERIQVSRFDVPPSLEGKRFRLVALPDRRYELRLDGKPVLAGEVGKAAASGPMTPGSERVELFVTELLARTGSEFELVKVPRADVIAGLQQRLAITEVGKKTGVIRIALDGPDPEKLVATLDAIARTYVRWNVERRSAEAEKTLEFIGAQLPVLRANVEAAEGALSGYRATKGTAIDLSLESKAMLDRATEVERKATELALQRAELAQRYTDDHPAVVTLKQKEARLSSERDAVNAMIRRLPEAELNSVRLVRDLKVATEMYVLLLNKAQELRVVKSGTVGNVRILDPASMPTRPDSPRALNTILFALLLGSGCGLAIAFGLKSIKRTLSDPEQIEAATGLSVYAAIPHSSIEEDAARRRRGPGGIELIAKDSPTDLAVENFRSLRTSILFALSEGNGNVISIAGPTPNIGKSFVSSNLAWVLAELGKRVVLVDGDLRRGRLHRSFGLPRQPGLSDCVQGSATLDEVLRTTDLPGLQVITMGSVLPNPTELLSSQRFQDLVETLSSRFDIVLFDTPPLLAVTDATLIGRSASVNLMVLRAGSHSSSQVMAAIRRLELSGVTTHALILNDVRPRLSAGRYGDAYHYKYD
jgi:tyrosine-protein kinase Etk/Wzc